MGRLVSIKRNLNKKIAPVVFDRFEYDICRFVDVKLNKLITLNSIIAMDIRQ